MELEQGSWSSPPNGAFPYSSDSSSIKEVSSFPSESTRESGFKTHSTDPKGGENCEKKDIIFSDDSNAADTYTFSDDLGDITQTSNDIDFFENFKDKDPGDFLYNGWPEIGNFDDVDRMFRSSDSTFGPGANKEDELNWSSSADDTEGTGDMPKTDFWFPLPETYPGKDLLQNDDPTETYYVDDPAMTCVPTFLKDSSWPVDKYESSLAKRPAMTKNSCLDDISLEAASLLQLQLIMEQVWLSSAIPNLIKSTGVSTSLHRSVHVSLSVSCRYRHHDHSALPLQILNYLGLLTSIVLDNLPLDLRTKLCIRDSLYRLAQSAEQRHKHANLDDACGDEKEASGAFVTDRINEHTGSMNMETDTNPIDRSTAHSLFHRPTDTYSVPANDSLPFRIQITKNGSRFRHYNKNG